MVTLPETAIELRGVGVRYDLDLADRAAVRGAFLRLFRPSGRSEHFWALRDLDFSVNRGEAVGIIGSNGAGKSTLLQVLARIIEPSAGSMLIRGRVTGMLSLGAGFDPNLSGRENIELVGALLRLTRAEILAKRDAIVEFADIGRFIDAPVKTYSSGMRARLGFSISTAADPDILLLDEVMAAGDAAFREKSKERVGQLVASAGAVVVVSHDLNWVSSFCSRALLLEGGSIVLDGSAASVVAEYRTRVRAAKAGTTPSIVRTLGEAHA
jgi:lipopolysaccharide transport system ATP-binding protein